MRYPCSCGLTYRYPHDLEEHRRVGHVQSSSGPTWSVKDVGVDEEATAAAVESGCDVLIVKPVEAVPEVVEPQEPTEVIEPIAQEEPPSRPRKRRAQKEG